MYYTNKHKKYYNNSKYNKKSKKHLVKNKKSKKGSRKYNKTKKQIGGFESMSLTSNPLIWTFQDMGNYLMNTLSGVTVPLSSNPTSQLI